MTRNVAARQNGQWKVISTLPDVCKTPVGSATPPVPYPVHAELEDSVRVAMSVRANSDPLVIYDRSYVPKTIGDKPGKAKGIKSGTVEGNCYPKTHSPTVRAEGCFVMRHDDEFWMNGP